MIRVQYDHQIFSMQRYGGISRYFANLQESLEDSEDFSYNAGILYTRNYYLKDRRFLLPRLVGDRFLKKDSKLHKWNKRYSRYIIQKNDFDVFHPTYYHTYFLESLKKPFVLTVHDMIHELFPSFFSQNDPYVYFKRVLIEKADHIIAISESTKNDIQLFFKVPDNKISVIYHGHKNEPSPSKDNYEPPFSNYILYVGERSGYKNFNLFIAGIAPLLKNRHEISLVCLGGGVFGYSEKELFYRHGINTEQVHQLSVTDNQLKAFYKKALLFVYPSLYEGFGLPLLEAFTNNCPIATSNTSCFPEIGGDAVAYFNPNDPDDIRNTIQSVISNAVLADQLRFLGTKQLKKFSMDSCMAKTKNVYKALL